MKGDAEHQSPLWQLMLWAVAGVGHRLSTQTKHPVGRREEAEQPFLGVPENARAAVLDLEAYGLRSLGLTQTHLARFSTRATAESLRYLLAISLGALRRSYRPNYVVVDQTVKACEHLSSRSKGFVNAFLRSFLFVEQGLEQDSDEALFNAPQWWRRHLIRAGLADVYRKTCLLSPPFCLRYTGPDTLKKTWLKELSSLGFRTHWQNEKTFWLTPARSVHKIPGYSQGLFRVQDASAQRLADLLESEKVQATDVLDACAAPGGKTFLLAEHGFRSLWAMDRSEQRLHRLKAETIRLVPWLKVSPSVAVHSLGEAPWPESCPKQFDLIVLDAPCSGSGVVRRHPEIPWRQTPRSLSELIETQARLLTSLWERLRPGGNLIYITCSIFPQEGEEQIKKFLLAQKNCQRLSAPGVILPSYQEHDDVPIGEDGFFYARLAKVPS